VSIDLLGALAVGIGLAGAAILWMGLRMSYLQLRLAGVGMMVAAIAGLLLGAAPSHPLGDSTTLFAKPGALLRVPGLAVQLGVGSSGSESGSAPVPGSGSGYFTIFATGEPLPFRVPDSPYVPPAGGGGPGPDPDPEPPPGNRAPVASPDSVVTTEDSAVTVDVLANDWDSDGDALSVANLSNPPNGSAVENWRGTVTYTPNAGFAGADSFTYDACDPGGLCDQAPVSVTVTAVNEAPAAGPDSATTVEDDQVTVNVLANDSDPDGDPLTVSNLSNPSSGSASNNGDGTVTYTPNTNFAGADSFTYDACDPGGLCDQASVSITVTAVNDAPAAGDDSATTFQDDEVTVNVLANDSDPDGDSLSVANLSDPPNGFATESGGTVTYTPDPGFLGTDSFTYEACDPGGLCSLATVTITVI
jgi:hypothetical protein